MPDDSMPKEARAEDVRRAILQQVDAAVETREAEPSLCELSFQSKSHSQRHVWMDCCDADEMRIDLEDWSRTDDVTGTVESLTVRSLDSAVRIVKTWLEGESLTSIT
jgi:hypothetical protein